MDKYKIIVSEQAHSMLRSHLRFLGRVNKDAAKRLRVRVTEAIRSLEKMPKKYPFFEAEYIPPNKYHKLFVENWFIILYQIKDDVVSIDYIIDCRKDYRWLAD